MLVKWSALLLVRFTDALGLKFALDMATCDSTVRLCHISPTPRPFAQESLFLGRLATIVATWWKPAPLVRHDVEYLHSKRCKVKWMNPVPLAMEVLGVMA